MNSQFVRSTGALNPTKISLFGETKVQKKHEGDMNDKRTAEHSFVTAVADVRQMEHGLLTLLDDFHSGQLQAFSEGNMYEKMDSVREQQEKLARTHFDLDSENLHSSKKEKNYGDEKNTNEDRTTRNVNQVMLKLQDLCNSINDLQCSDQINKVTKEL